VKYGEQFFRIEDQITYNYEKGFVYEGKNLQKEEGSRLSKADLYINGNLVFEQIPFQYLDSGGSNTVNFLYTPTKDALNVQWQEADGCGSFYETEGYRLSTKELFVKVGIYDHYGSNPDGAVLEYGNKKLEVFPVLAANTTSTYSLKYRYSTKETDGWRVRLEDYIVRSQRHTTPTTD
jgi:hypothetical protein